VETTPQQKKKRQPERRAMPREKNKHISRNRKNYATIRTKNPHVQKEGWDYLPIKKGESWTGSVREAKGKTKILIEKPKKQRKALFTGKGGGQYTPGQAVSPPKK